MVNDEIFGHNRKLTVNDFYRFIAEKLKEYNIPDPEFEARLLTCYFLDIEHSDFLLKRSFDMPFMPENFYTDLSKRISGVPLQYIIGEWEFYGNRFFVGEGVLIPRPETEFLVELAAGYVNKNSAVADLCAGSGCVGITLSKLTGCNARLFELSPEAELYTRKNFLYHKVNASLVHGDILDKELINDQPVFDAIVSNPPYLTAKDMTELQPEVKHEPEMALYGGRDGLDFYRRMFSLWLPKLKRGGIFAVEIGMGQENQVGSFLQSEGIEPDFITDYNKIVRIVYGIK